MWTRTLNKITQPLSIGGTRTRKSSTPPLSIGGNGTRKRDHKTTHYNFITLYCADTMLVTHSPTQNLKVVERDTNWIL